MQCSQSVVCVPQVVLELSSVVYLAFLHVPRWRKKKSFSSFFLLSFFQKLMQFPFKHVLTANSLIDWKNALVLSHRRWHTWRGSERFCSDHKINKYKCLNSIQTFVGNTIADWTQTIHPLGSQFALSLSCAMCECIFHGQLTAFLSGLVVSRQLWR